MKLIATAVIALATLVPHAQPAEGNDWPQWRGPNRDGVSHESGLLGEWPADGPPLAWRVDGLGGGYGAPAIADGGIYGLSNRGDDEMVWRLSEDGGEEVWSIRLGPAVTEGMRQGVEGPGSTPTVEGDHLYVIGAGGTVACLKTSNGEEVWRRSLPEDFGGVVPTWRYSESPLIEGEMLICTPGANDATLVALNKSNGEMIWKSVPAQLAGESPDEEQAAPPNEGGRRRGGRGPGGPRSSAGYSSAIAIDAAGLRQIVQFTATALVGVAASDGAPLWRYQRPANQMGINCSTPVFQDGMVFASSAYGAGGGLVRLESAGDAAVEAEEVYEARRMQNHHGGMILHDGVLYGAAGGNGGGFLRSIDFKTGDELWAERRAQKGALAFADNRLYLRTEEGELLLIEPSREEFLERGRFDQPDRTDSPAWTHPVIANGKLYVRDQGMLFCYDIKARGAL